MQQSTYEIFFTAVIVIEGHTDKAKAENAVRHSPLDIIVLRGCVKVAGQQITLINDND